LERYYVALTKPRKNAIPSLGYIVTPWVKLFWSKQYIRVLLMPRKFTKHAIPLLGYAKNTLGFITYILTHGRVLYSPMKQGNQYLH